MSSGCTQMVLGLKKPVTYTFQSTQFAFISISPGNKSFKGPW